MKVSQFQEGVAYAEENFSNDRASHLQIDKQVIKGRLDLTGKKVLDFGAGMGGMSLWYASNWQCDVLGVDIDEQYVKIAQHIRDQHHAHNVKFEKRDVLVNPLDEKFDFIFMNDVVQHIEAQRLRLILRLLKKMLTDDGKIFISYPPWQSPYASHLMPAIRIPWCQYLPDRLLQKMVQKNNQEIVGKAGNIWSVYQGLNKLTHSKLHDIVNSIDLKVAFRKTHSILNRINIFSDWNWNIFPFHYLITKEFIILSKKS